MTNTFKLASLVLALFVSAGTSFAREEVRPAGGLYEGIQTGPAEFRNWDQIRSMVLSSYGLAEIPDISPGAMGPVGDPGNPEVFEVREREGSVLSFVGKPIPPQLLSRLPRLFPDLTEEDLLRYDEGLVLTVSSQGDRQVRADALLLRRILAAPKADGPIFKGPSFEDDFGLVFPEDSMKFNTTQTPGMQLITVLVPITVEETLSGFATQLVKDDLEPRLLRDGPNGTIEAVNGNLTLSIVANAVEGEPDSVVQIRITETP